ncbi:MAG: PAS domain S-box protein [Anaerolineae bacterium]|nr:PAS domain S-box protein [Anaerolineae bacterium]
MTLILNSSLRDSLVQSIQKRLTNMLYEHRSYLRLSAIKGLANAEVDCFDVYLHGADDEILRQHACKRAEEGLSVQALLCILTSIDEFLHLKAVGDELQDVVQSFHSYMTTYMGTFVEWREGIILREQERIRAALQGSLSRHTLWLQTASDVSREATSTLDLKQLIRVSVDLIRRHFNFSHVSLYLANPKGKYAVLFGSSGDGAVVPTRAQKLKINDQTLIGRCMIGAHAQIIIDVDEDASGRDAGTLENTRSAMALPLISRRQVIGALFIQSSQRSAFYDDDVSRLQTVADQISNAVQNARLYYELQMHSQDLAEAVRIRTIELQKTKDRVEAILNNSPDAILLLNADCRIELQNPAFYDMFGYETGEVQQIALNELVARESLEPLQKLLINCLDKGSSLGFEIIGLRKDQTTFNAGMALAAIREDGILTGLVCTMRNITEQVQAEEHVKTSLREKEVLLQEIHHRVKNNMQVISSLLALQAGYTADEMVDQMFRESQNRIRSMALVHEQLCRSKDLARIDFAKYVSELAANLMQSYRTAVGRVSLEIEAQSVNLDIDTAIPCGLIINELVSNSLKHAFPDNKTGKIVVELHSDDVDLHTIIVRDNGVGFPPGLNVYKTETLGLQLVVSLTSQLNATIGVHQGHGTTFEIRLGTQGKEGKRTANRLERTHYASSPA